MSPKIAIIGAGLAGLVCARILEQSGFQVTVFERESSSEARSQGGTLDLHPLTGQEALRKAGLIKEFEKNVRYEGEGFTLADRHGKVYVKVTSKGGDRPEIDRTVLRKLLLDSLKEGTIKWDRNLKAVNKNNKELVFEHGVESGFDLIVGADGAWSKVRPLLTTVKPFYSGVSGVELRHNDVDRQNPKISEMVGSGSFFSFGDEKQQCILSQRNGDGSIRTYAFERLPVEWIDDYGSEACKSAKEDTIARFKDWSPELLELLKTASDDAIPRALFMLPVGLTWPHDKSITLIGDSASLMTPFAGEGANIAMADGMKLAESIITNSDNLDKAIAEYEDWMFAFSKKAANKTWESLQDRFREGGNLKFANYINERISARG